MIHGLFVAEEKLRVKEIPREGAPSCSHTSIYFPAIRVLSIAVQYNGYGFCNPVRFLSHDHDMTSAI